MIYGIVGQRIKASAPVQAVKFDGSPMVSSGSISANDGLTSGCHIQNFIPSLR